MYDNVVLYFEYGLFLCGNLIHAKNILELWVHGFIAHVKYRHVIKTILLMSLTLSLYLAK